MIKYRAVFLDRDGVLNKAVYREGKSFPPDNVDSLEIMPGANTAMAQLKSACFLCICITNQPDIARGIRTPQNVNEMNEKIKKTLALDALYMCPHDNSDNCSCRKPKPGMLLAAANDLNVDLASSWVIGDRPTDIAAGRSAGCKTILMARLDNLDSNRDFFCDSIIEAVKIIVTHV